MCRARCSPRLNGKICSQICILCSEHGLHILMGRTRMESWPVTRPGTFLPDPVAQSRATLEIHLHSDFQIASCVLNSQAVSTYFIAFCIYFLSANPFQCQNELTYAFSPHSLDSQSTTFIKKQKINSGKVCSDSQQQQSLMQNVCQLLNKGFLYHLRNIICWSPLEILHQLDCDSNIVHKFYFWF